MTRIRLCAAALLAVLTALPLPAFAHAVLLESSPAAAATVKPGRVELVLRYNSRIDAARSRLTLIRPGGAQDILPINPGETPDTLRAAADLAPGAQILRWQVLAIDGHITRGELRFAVMPAQP